MFIQDAYVVRAHLNKLALFAIRFKQLYVVVTNANILVLRYIILQLEGLLPLRLLISLCMCNGESMNDEVAA